MNQKDATGRVLVIKSRLKSKQMKQFKFIDREFISATHLYLHIPISQSIIFSLSTFTKNKTKIKIKNFTEQSNLEHHQQAKRLYYYLIKVNTPQQMRLVANILKKAVALRPKLRYSFCSNNDHRHIGLQQQLFNFSEMSPGSPFFLPKGALIYNKLIQLMRSQYTLRGYSEVISPNIYHSQLWKRSGHYFKYKENIYFIKQSGQQHGLKPMNCPGHCLMFDFAQKSYKDLPVRMADFGVLHRNQIHGALSGLTRVRRFQQDDAHIFCTPNQIQTQILAVLDLLDYVYSLFGFKYVLQLSTRPEKYLGGIQQWNKAQFQLKDALIKFGKEYKINEGDGAFYGPKIDVKLFDALGRQHQCGTIQLDFQLPIRFNLQYRTSDSKENEENQKETEIDKNVNEQSQQAKYAKVGHLKQGFARPVIIHRAIFGSVQRFIAILCQHTSGKWDFWISPRQIKLIVLPNTSLEYASKVYNTLLLKGYSVELDNKAQTLNKRIRNAQVQGFNFIGVIGKEETASQTINVRKRDEAKQLGKMNVQSLLALLESYKPSKSKRRLEIQKESFDYKA